METDFTDLVAGEWQEVCFYGSGTGPELVFRDLKNDDIKIELSDSYNVQEDYMEKSPLVFGKESCWERGTKFTISRWLATSDRKKLLIQVEK